MTVPKTTETRGRDGSVQARHVIQRLHKLSHPNIFLTLSGEHALQGLQYLSCVCVSVCLSHPANLQTGASRRLTEGTSGLSGPFFTKQKGVFTKNASLGS